MDGEAVRQIAQFLKVTIKPLLFSEKVIVTVPFSRKTYL